MPVCFGFNWEFSGSYQTWKNLASVFTDPLRGRPPLIPETFIHAWTVQEAPCTFLWHPCLAEAACRAAWQVRMHTHTHTLHNKDTNKQANKRK